MSQSNPLESGQQRRKELRKKFRLGPGLLVTAAFIGPGTVVTASKAGAEYGCDLLWTVLYACVGTVVLQSFAARVGILRGEGLGESLRNTLKESAWLRPAILLVISAIGIGNAAYQTGNLTGAANGISILTGGNAVRWVAILMTAACGIIWIGRYRVLHTVLVGLVVLLSVTFLCTALLALPTPSRILSGLFTPQVRLENLTVVIGLIGTTIVPYNLFLHASGAASTWKETDKTTALWQSDWDTILSVSLGGLVTAAIMLTACSALHDTETEWTAIEDIGKQLQPTLGSASKVAFALGLFAAGLTSSITAPLATAYAVCGCMSWSSDPADKRFRVIALSVVLIGGVVAMSLGKSPGGVILFAQVANGLILPVVATFLLWVVFRSSGLYQIGPLRKSLGILTIISVSALGVYRIWTVFL